VFPLNLYAHVRFCQVRLAHETAGAACTRSSLRPLFLRGREVIQQTSGDQRRENAKSRSQLSNVVLARMSEARSGAVLELSRISLRSSELKAL
jgi:hypothetical protein